MKVNKFVLVLLLFMILIISGLSTITSAESPVKELDVEELFKEKEGTVVLKNMKDDQTYVFNNERSTKRLTPESTFKMPNALIGLESGAVRDEYEVKRWDGVIREFESWNRDHSLASAMRESVIWFYQDMAGDIGEKKMQENISRMDYGNEDISGGIDTFWLNSSMKISAIEQVDFMERLVKEELPFQEKHQKTVKRIMIQDEQDEYILHGKTGTRLSDLGLGWYVGFIETDKNVWLFAVNINGTGSEAKNIAIQTLKQKKIINVGK